MHPSSTNAATSLNTFECHWGTMRSSYPLKDEESYVNARLDYQHDYKSKRAFASLSYPRPRFRKPIK